MKFVCDGMILSDAALTVSKACAVKTITPILECIKRLLSYHSQKACSY